MNTEAIAERAVQLIDGDDVWSGLAPNERRRIAGGIADLLRSATEPVSPLTHPNPWNPDVNVANLRILGKLAEETGEQGSAAARCIIQGIDESEPVSGKSNRQWLSEEIADVRATQDLAIEHFGLDLDFIIERTERKKHWLRRWFSMMEGGAA